MNFAAMALWIAIATAVAVGQQAPAAAGTESCLADVQDFKQWLQKTPLTDGGQYVVDDDRKQRLLTGYPQLKVGMTSHQIEDLLGKPDFAVTYYGTQPPPTAAETAAKCPSEVAYMLWKKTDTMLDGRDFEIHVFFTGDGKLAWAQPWNIPSLKPVGAPRAPKL